MSSVSTPDRGHASPSSHAMFYVKRIPETFLAVALGLIILNDLSRKFFDHAFFDSTQAILKLAAPIILSLGYTVVRQLSEMKTDIASLHHPGPDRITVLPGENAVPCAELLSSRSQIDILTLAGGVIVPLDQEHVRNAIRDPRRVSRVRCLVANPHSAAIVNRYANDEPHWKDKGTEAIEARLVWLFNLIETLDLHGQERLLVRVYDSYPMLSVFRADDEMYASYYAYRLRGADTPMLVAGVRTYFGTAVMKHFEKLYEESPSLARWMVAHYPRLRRPNECRFGVRYSGVFVETTDGALVLQERDSADGVENPGQLSVFGGRAEGDESAVGAALRELREETGIRATPRDLTLIATVPFLLNETSQRCMLCSYYVMRNVEVRNLRVNEGKMCQLTLDEALRRDDLTDLPRQLLSERARAGAWPTPPSTSGAEQSAL